MNDTQEHTTRTATVPIDPQRMADLTAAFFLQGSQDPRLGERLALGHTTVHIHYADDAGVTLWLDRAPIEATPHIEGTAEIELWGSPELFMSFTLRKKHMAMSIMRGELEYDGPVRKFLRIAPILRSFDFAVWDELRAGTPATG
jgi:hypothetical protein